MSESLTCSRCKGLWNVFRCAVVVSGAVLASLSSGSAKAASVLGGCWKKHRLASKTQANHPFAAGISSPTELGLCFVRARSQKPVSRLNNAR